MYKNIWIGKYESEIEGTDDLFFASITIFGSNNGNNYSFGLNEIGSSKPKFCKFIYETAKNLISSHENIKFHFYNEQWAYEILTYDASIEHYFVLLNSKELLVFLNDKAMTRVWLSKELKIPPFIMIGKDECELAYLKSSFPGKHSFIIQENVSSGGKGTFIVNNENIDTVRDSFNDFSIYLVSPNLTNSISLNATIIIGTTQTIFFPISQQIFDTTSPSLDYMGADFISSIQFAEEFSEKIDAFLKYIVQQLKASDYYGIIGIDFLIYNDNLYFIEFNPRFQGSTFLINRALLKQHNITIYDILLREVKLPFDMMQINLSFTYKPIQKQPLDIVIDNNIYKYIYNVSIGNPNYSYSSDDYYDYFADKYHLILPDYNGQIEKQGKILKDIFNKYSKIKITNILDCTCGIGVQTISLANLGYNVVGSDISLGKIEFAKKETEKRKLSVEYYQADCMMLEKTFDQIFDAIISIDSAMPHLMNEENFFRAFSSIYKRLNKGGIFLASFRDYDSIVKDKPDWAYQPRLRKINDKTVIIIRNLEWNNDICTSHQYFIENENGKTQLFYNTYQQWAVTRDKVLQIVHRIPYSESFWILPDKSNFYQPLLCLIK